MPPNHILPVQTVGLWATALTLLFAISIKADPDAQVQSLLMILVNVLSLIAFVYITVTETVPQLYVYAVVAIGAISSLKWVLSNDTSDQGKAQRFGDSAQGQHAAASTGQCGGYTGEVSKRIDNNLTSMFLEGSEKGDGVPTEKRQVICSNVQTQLESGGALREQQDSMRQDSATSEERVKAVKQCIRRLFNNYDLNSSGLIDSKDCSCRTSTSPLIRLSPAGSLKPDVP